NSNEASATATGDCRIPPVFAGATGATSAGTASCGVNVAWAAATPSCAGPITYSVYRSRNGSFTPGPTNLIASGVTGTSYADTANLVFPNAYHYVVRAVETSGTSTNVDTNTVRRSVVPGGPVAPAITYLDDLNANRPPNADSYWIAGSSALQKSGCHWQSTNTAWRFGGTNGATCPSSYANSIQTRMVLGGNGANGINGFVFPPASTGTMTFRHAWDFNDVVGTTFFDGVVLDYSTVGPAGPWTKILTTVSTTEPYITAGGYNGTIATFLGGACWTGLQALTNGSFLTTSVNLDALAGQTVWFAWRYRTDSSVVREGHYFDDIAINVSGPSACTTNQGTPGPAVAYEVRLPTTSGAGAAVNLDINALDGAEQIATGYAGTANLTTSDAQATIPATATFTAGVANLSATFGTIGLQTVTAVDDTVSSITGTGGTMVTPGAPARLRFSIQPTNATAGVAVAPAIRVQVTDTFGNLVPTATDSITLAIGANPSGGTLRGTLTQAAVAGVATFNDINIREAGVGYDLVAASGTLTSATSSAFNINADVPAALRYTQQPSDIRAGDLFNPLVQLEILDQYNNRNTTGTWLVLIGFETNPANGNLLGTTLADSANGLATFTDISVDRVGTGYSFTAFATFDQATSNTFSVSPNNPHHLTISTQPGDTAVNTPLSPVTVAVRDRFENLATQSNAPITAALLGGTPGAVLGGTKIRNAVAGLATFDDLTVNRAGTAYTLRMGSTGLFSADTVGFDVAAGPTAVAVEFVNQPSNSAAGAAISPAITVRVVDASGNTVVDASDPVTLSMGANPGGGSLSGGLTSTPVNGVATFSTVSINKSGSGYTLVASSAALTSATSSPFDVAAGAAASLAFGTQPTNTRAGQPITPAVTVRALDAFGNLSAFSGAVTVTLSGGNPNASLGGTTTVNAAAGVATFSNLSVNKKGSSYALAASASGLSGATSNPFNISSGPASKLVISGLGFSVTSYSDVLFTVTAYDDQDNLAEDYVGTAAITSNDTAAALPANATFVSGVAKDVKIVFKTTGVHTVTATDTTTSSLTATANLVVTNFPQPTVSITEPGNGTSVAIGSVSITATATVATGTTLSKLEIFVDGSSVSSGTTSPATASWDTSKMEKGTTHLIHAVASDAAGNVVQSTPLTVIITSEGGCGCTTGSGGADMALLAAVGAALRAIGFRRRRAAKK
ncbi:MAG TPA: Ig-like domain-containing protein, partial [Myxococcales bacterium]|nr:Ig-like domain-containing protein [Myxococcales bacterium]